MKKIFAFSWKILKLSCKLILYYLIFWVVHTLIHMWFTRNEFQVEVKHSDWTQVSYRVPLHIAKRRDCDELYKFQHENMPRLLHGLCPWAKFREKRKIGFDNVWFDIPRKYLMFMSHDEKDGVPTAVFGGFLYPSIEGFKETEFGNHVSFYMDDISSSIAAADPYKYYYNQFLGIDKDSEYDIVHLNYDTDMQLQAYRVDEHYVDLEQKEALSSSYLYTNDDPRNPKEFVACQSATSNYCRTIFIYKDIIIKYGIPRKYLADYQDIKNKFLKLLETYETPKPIVPYNFCGR